MIPIIDRYGDRESVKTVKLLCGEENYLRKVWEIEVLYLSKLTGDKTIVDFVMSSFDYKKIKIIEKKDKHDIVSVCKYLQKVLKKLKYDERTIQMVHFGLTSQDLVSLANTIIARDMWVELQSKTGDMMSTLLYTHHFRLMGRTHGQKAMVTSWNNILTVLQSRIDMYSEIDWKSRFGNGAVGNKLTEFLLNEIVGENDVNISECCEEVLSYYGINNTVSQQTDYYPSITRVLGELSRVSLVLEDFCKDMWGYVSNGTFGQTNDTSQSGSSTMSHKINPIKFENAEGNFHMTHNFATILQKKLSCSRWERDLSDLTVIRNLSLVWSWYLLGVESMSDGFKELTPKINKINLEIDTSYECYSELINLMLRLKGVKNSYDISKDMFKGKVGLSKTDFIDIIKNSKHFDEKDVEKINKNI